MSRTRAGVVDVVVIGAGHSGLAMSSFLADAAIDHVVLERGEIANSWRRERWDSLRLLTPNWQSRLPGYRYSGPDPRRLHDDAGGHRVHRPLRPAHRRAGARAHHGDLGATSTMAAIGSSRIAANGAAARWSSPAARTTSRMCRRSPRTCRVGPLADAEGVPQPGAARFERRAHRRRVGHRRAAGRRNPALRPAGHARGRRAHPHAARVSRPRHPVVA